KRAAYNRRLACNDNTSPTKKPTPWLKGVGLVWQGSRSVRASRLVQITLRPLGIDAGIGSGPAHPHWIAGFKRHTRSRQRFDGHRRAAGGDHAAGLAFAKKQHFRDARRHFVPAWGEGIAGGLFDAQ